MKKLIFNSPTSRITILVLPLIAAILSGIIFVYSPAPSVQVASASPIKVGLITDTAGINDNGFNEMSYQGLLRAQVDFGVVPVYYESSSPADFETNLAQCVTDGNDLCISVGFLMGDATLVAANTYPATKFAIVDVTYDIYPSNLRGFSFGVDQPAFLAGVLSNLMSQTKIVGVIGGMEIPTVTMFTESYRNGALCANSSNTTVLLTYTNNFVDPTLGAQVAQDMISQGADVIFTPAGPTGAGAILSATQSGKWGIGVDDDNYLSVFDNGTVNGSDKLLTSVIKKLDNAVYSTIEDVVSATFTPGTKVYNMANDGTGLAPFHETDSLISPVVKARLGQVRNDILAGKINVNSSNCPQYLFAPIIIK